MTKRHLSYRWADENGIVHRCEWVGREAGTARRSAFVRAVCHANHSLLDEKANDTPATCLYCVADCA